MGDKIDVFRPCDSYCTITNYEIEIKSTLVFLLRFFFCLLIKKADDRVEEMTQLVRACTSLTEDSNVVPRTHAGQFIDSD